MSNEEFIEILNDYGIDGEELFNNDKIAFEVAKHEYEREIGIF